MADERDDRPKGRREDPYSGPETTASFGYEFGSQLSAMAGRSTEEQAAVNALPSGSALLVVRIEQVLRDLGSRHAALGNSPGHATGASSRSCPSMTSGRR